MARVLYWSLLLFLFAVFAVGGLLDWSLWSARQQTMTDYLRSHPPAFWGPAVVAFLAVCGVALHLFVFRPR
jgi:hypothetical protein